MPEPYVNFEGIKEDVNILDVARRCGFELSGDGIFFHGFCCMPTHGSHHKKREFVVNIPENYWRCWSESCNRSNGGKRGGDVINFVATFQGCTEHEAAMKIVSWFGRKPEATPKAEVVVCPASEKKAPSSDETMPRENGAHTTGEPVNPTAQAQCVKPRYMQEIDKWFDALMARGEKETDEVYWKRVRNGVKARLLESYRNGKKAISPSAS